MNGHQFVKKQFFQVILCALCNKFLVTGDGYQCDDCRYMCHEHCYTKVLTKCISKPNVEAVSPCSRSTAPDRVRLTRSTVLLLQEGDEDKINHNIPHRFESYSNLSPNWCCHCGFLLPLGRKIPRKCTGSSLPVVESLSTSAEPRAPFGLTYRVQLDLPRTMRPPRAQLLRYLAGEGQPHPRTRSGRQQAEEDRSLARQQANPARTGRCPPSPAPAHPLLLAVLGPRPPLPARSSTRQPPH